MENNDWRLSTINIHQDYSKPDLYVGEVYFKNGIKMQVNFLLDQTRCNQYLALIQDDLISHAKTLGDSLIKSMPIALPPAAV